MKGWKTYVAAGLVIGAELARQLGYGEVAAALLAVGGAAGLIGIGHKIEKAGKA